MKNSRELSTVPKISSKIFYATCKIPAMQGGGGGGEHTSEGECVSRQKTSPDEASGATLTGVTL